MSAPDAAGAAASASASDPLPEAMALAEGAARDGIGLKLLGADWGWWRTVTGNLAKLPGLIAEKPELVPVNAAYDPREQIQRLSQLAADAPKSVKWRLRSNVGDRVRWYELPEEVAH